MGYSYQYFVAVNIHHPKHTMAVVTVEVNTRSSTSANETSVGGDQFLGRIRIPSDEEEMSLNCGGFREKVSHCTSAVGSVLALALALAGVQEQTSVSGTTFSELSGPVPSLYTVRGTLRRFVDAEGRHLQQKSDACGSGCTSSLA